MEEKTIKNKDVTPKSEGERKKRGMRPSDWLLILLAVGLIAFLSTAVVTRQDEYTLILQFRRIVNVIERPGLNFRIPFIQTVEKRENKILVYDLTRSDVITSDKKAMIVDSYVLWRITDPVRYYQTLSGLRVNAEGRIDTVVYNAIKNTISSMTQDEVIVSRDGTVTVTQLELISESFFFDMEDEDSEDTVIKIMSLTDEISANLIDVSDYGIEIITVEVKALDLPDSNKEAVYNRMISEREKVRTMYLSEGESQAQMIRNQADMDVSVMLAGARSDAAVIIAEGEAEYMQILSTAYNDAEKSDFYEFVRSLEAAKIAYDPERGNILMIDAASPMAQLFYGFSEDEPEEEIFVNLDLTDE